MDTLFQDIRYAVRGMRTRPGFTAVTVLTLALGIGAATAIFSFVDGIVLRPLSYAEPDRLVMVWEDWTGRGGPADEWTSPADFLDMRERNRVLEGLAAFTPEGLTLTGDGEPERLDAGVVSPGFFSILGVRPERGRQFRMEEESPASARVAVLGHGLWQRRFGSDSDVVGRTVTLDGNAHTVVGVLPEGFEFSFAQDAEIWVPLRIDPAETCRGCIYLRTVGRLRPGVTIERARADLARVAAELEQEYPRVNAGESTAVTRLHAEVVGPVRTALLVLLAAVGFLLLIACANIANLQLAQAAKRQGEIAVRSALGAGRRRLARQLITETVVLAGVGGAAGVLLAFWGVGVLRSMVPAGTPRLAEVGVDPRVLGFAVLATVLTGVAFGLAPAWHVARRDLAGALRKSGRGGDAGRRRTRHALVVGELAVALVLLVGAGLMISSFVRLNRVDPGFRTDNLLTGSVALPSTRYESEETGPAMYRILDRAEALPGVRSAVAVSTLPLGGGVTDVSFRIEGRPEPRPGEAPGARYSIVTPGYFRAMGIRVQGGRVFTERDRADASRAVVIDAAMARRHWPDEDPIGERIVLSSNSYEIVGVVGGVRHFGPDRQPRPSMYFAHGQVGGRRMMLVLRTQSDPLDAAGPLQAAVREVDADLPVSDIATMSERFSRSVAAPRLYTTLLAFFAAAALILASLGIYGVISYSVAQRRREIGLRLALGAGRGKVQRLVVRQGLALAGIGAAIGVVGALGLTRLLSSLLFGVQPTDPATFAGVVVVLGGVAVLACWLPARRAARIDPMVALRTE